MVGLIFFEGRTSAGGALGLLLKDDDDEVVVCALNVSECRLAAADDVLCEDWLMTVPSDAPMFESCFEECLLVVVDFTLVELVESVQTS